MWKKIGGSVAAAALVTAGVAFAGPAQAMGTFRCDVLGTAGADTLDISVPEGTSAADPYVVCPRGGTDTLNINSVPPDAYLYLAMGNGQKTVNWNAPVDEWGCDPALCAPGYEGLGIITRPAANPDIIMGGEADVNSAFFACGTNVQYQSADTQGDLFDLTGGAFLEWNRMQDSNEFC